nr:hypothetical protein [Candidatus Gracilibacteria bacterium]
MGGANKPPGGKKLNLPIYTGGPSSWPIGYTVGGEVDKEKGEIEKVLDNKKGQCKCGFCVYCKERQKNKPK